MKIWVAETRFMQQIYKSWFRNLLPTELNSFLKDINISIHPHITEGFMDF